LKRQLLGELASIATLEASELTTLWQAGSAESSRECWGRCCHVTSTIGPGRAPRAANQLDRILWLMLHRAELWWELDGDAHNLLADQAEPYATLFACVERCLHDHGPMNPAALHDEIARCVGTMSAHRTRSIGSPDFTNRRRRQTSNCRWICCSISCDYRRSIMSSNCCSNRA
jgi:hypothetical protein